MRPRPKDRGNEAVSLRKAQERAGFNEAATKRSRKLAAANTFGTFWPRSSFNEAATKRSRKPVKIKTDTPKGAELQ